MFVRELPTLGQLGSTTLRTFAKGSSVSLSVLTLFVGKAGGGEGSNSRSNEVRYKSQTPAETLPTKSIETAYAETVASSAVVTLYEGFVAEQNGHYRGYGWEYIQATSSLTQEEIKRVLNGGRVVHDGEITYVIGETYTDTERAILTIIDGTLMAASAVKSVEDGTSECREIHYTNDQVQGHSSRDEKVVDWTDILTTIEDPAAVGSGSDLLYYIRKTGNEGYVIVKVWKDVPRHVLYQFGKHIDNWFGTTLIDQNNKELFDSLKDAKEQAEQNAESQGDEITNWNDDPKGC